MKRLLAFVICLISLSGFAANPSFQEMTNTINALIKSNAYTVWMDANGSDSNPGTRSLPKKSLTNCVATWPSGRAGAIMVQAGTYNESNYVIMPPNVSIVGPAGAAATVMSDWFTNAVPTPLIIPTLNNLVAGLTISNVYRKSASGVGASACIGTHQNVGGRGYTNFTGMGLVLWGGSDTWYNRSSNNIINARMVNSDLYGEWDVVTAFGVGGSGPFSTQYLTLDNCRLFHTAEFTHANQKDIAVTSFAVRGGFTFNNCYLYKSNGLENNDYFLSLEIDSSAPNQFATFNNCVFSNATPANADWNFVLGSKVRFINCGDGLDITKMGDGIDPVTGLTFSSNIVSSISFGGDAAGLKPVIGPASLTVLPFTGILTGNGAGVTNWGGGYFKTAFTHPAGDYDGLIISVGDASAGSAGGDMAITAGANTVSGAQGSSISVDSAHGNMGGSFGLSSGSDASANAGASLLLGGGNGITAGGGVLLSSGNSDSGGAAASLEITSGNGATNGVVNIVGIISGNGSGLTNLTGNDTAYAASWNGNTNVPTKNAVYDKIETIGSGTGIATNGGSGIGNRLTNLTVVTALTVNGDQTNSGRGVFDSVIVTGNINGLGAIGGLSGAFSGNVTVTSNLTAGSASFAQGTITDPATALSITGTWNDAADTFTAFKINMTNTASAAGSYLMDLQVGGASKVKFTRGADFMADASYVYIGTTSFGKTLAFGSGAELLASSADTLTVRNAAESMTVTVGGVQKVDTTATGNVGAGTDTLISYTVPAGRLSANGQFLEFDVWGTCAANTNPKDITVVYGGTTLIDGGAVVLNGVSWKAHGKIVRTGAATQTANCELTVGGTLLSAVNGTIALTTSPTETLSGAVTFKCTGTSTIAPADNDIVQNGMILKWYPGQ